MEGEVSRIGLCKMSDAEESTFVQIWEIRYSYMPNEIQGLSVTGTYVVLVGLIDYERRVTTRVSDKLVAGGRRIVSNAHE